MKKLLTATILATTMTSAYANTRFPPAGYVIQNPNQYQSAYNSGYHSGKQDAYNKVAKTVFVTVAVVVAGTIIYQLGKESRWTANENGIVWRF